MSADDRSVLLHEGIIRGLQLILDTYKAWLKSKKSAHAAN